MALTLLLASHSAAQAPEVPVSSHLAPVTSLQFVKLAVPPKDHYEQLRESNVARVAAEDAAKAAQAALVAQQQAEAAKEQAEAQAAPPAPTVQPSGNCADWLAAAGVSDVSDAMTLINMESGCNPYARNPFSGACGVAQELPCGKSGCAYGDGACEVAWMNKYTLERYGSWAAAVAFHLANNWY